MIKRIQQYNKQHPEIWIQIIFLLLSVAFISPYFVFNTLNNHDMFFNYLRIREIGENIIHLHIPSFTIYTNELLGSATSYFYPYLLLIPMAILSVFLTGTQVLEIITFVGIYGGLNITRQAWKIINKSNKFDCLFTLIYCASSMSFAIGYARGDIGAFYSAMIAPIAFIGYYEWLKHGKWKMMAIGTSMFIYSNEASAICLLLGFIVLTICNIKKLSGYKIINLIKSIILTLVLTMAYWLPMLIVYTQNKIFIPSQTVEPSYSSRPLIFTTLRTYFIPQLCYKWGLLDLLGILISITYWKKFSQFEHQLGLMGLLIYAINIRPIAIWILTNTFLSKIQSVNRFVFMSHFIFTLFLVQYLIYILPTKISLERYKHVFSILFGWMLTVIVIGICTQITVNTVNLNKLYQPYVSRSIITEMYKENHIYSIHDNMLHNPIILHGLPINYGDYYPSSNVKIKASNKHTGEYDYLKVSPRLKEYTTINELRYYSRNNQYHKILMVIMNGQIYHFQDNNHPVKIRTYHHLVYVKMHKGINRIRIYIPTMWYQYSSMISSICGVGYLILERKKDKND